MRTPLGWSERARALALLTIPVLALGAAACGKRATGTAGEPPGDGPGSPVEPPGHDPASPVEPPGDGPGSPGNPPAPVAGFSVTRLDGLSGPFSAAIALNRDGVAVGVSDDGTGAVKGVRWIAAGAAVGAPVALSPLAGNAHSAAYAISRDGIAVGESELGAASVAVAWPSPATPTELRLGALAPPAVAYAIDGRTVVGEATTTAGATVAALWAELGAEATPLGTLPGGTWSAAYAISGEHVVGESDQQDGRSRGVVWRVRNGCVDGTPRALPPLPGHVASLALGVSDGHQIVGESEAPSGRTHAVAWALDADGHPGAPVDLGPGSASGAHERTVAGAYGAPPRVAVWDALQVPFVLAELPGAGHALATNEHGVVVGIADGRAFVATPFR